MTEKHDINVDEDGRQVSDGNLTRIITNFRTCLHFGLGVIKYHLLTVTTLFFIITNID